MSFNPDIHHRQSIRLKDYDYSAAGAYFITICTQHRECLLGDIADGEMRLSPMGDCALSQWHELPNRFSGIQLDAFVVMPNHIHGILCINPVPTSTNPVGAPLAGAQIPPGAQMPPDTPRTNHPVGAPLAGAQISPDAQFPPGASETRATARVAPTVGGVIGAYKSLVFNRCLLVAKQNGKYLGNLWQRNYWERVIRDETELHIIREYIHNNPGRWELDKLYVGAGV